MFPVISCQQLETTVGVQKRVHIISSMANSSMTGTKNIGMKATHQKQLTTLGKYNFQDQHYFTYCNIYISSIQKTLTW
jgi:hypothetical protein